MTRLKVVDGEINFELDEVDTKIRDKGLDFHEEPVGIDFPTGSGYLLVNIDDALENSGVNYRICRKLGFGSNSNVWLVHDGSKYLVLKVLTQLATALAREESSEEYAVLTMLRSRCSNDQVDHPGCRHIAYPVDFLGSFADHLCILFEPIGPNIHTLRRSADNRRLSPELVRVLSRQILLAIQFLHEICGIVHTDIKPDNILVRSFLDDRTISELLCSDPARTYPEESWTLISKEEQTYRLEHPDDESHIFIPIHEVVSQPLPAPPLTEIQKLEFTLADFGNAQFIAHKKTNGIASLLFRAPETILKLSWNEKVDIWAFGYTVYQLIVGKDLIPDPKDSLSADFDIHHLSVMSQLTTTDFPVEMLHNTARDDLRDHRAFFQLAEGTKEQGPTIHAQLASAGLTGDELERVSAFIRHCLTIDPDRRPSATELLKDPWLQ